jgi:Uma2 family endonuclease
MSRLMSNPATPGSAVLLTVEDFERICERPENADKRLELVNGEVVEAPRPAKKHGFLQSRLTIRLGNYAEARRPPDFVVCESGVVIRESPATVRGPDVAYFRDRAAEDFTETWFRNPPLIAVEVVSPDENRKELAAKIDDFLAMGVRYVWAVHPDNSLVLVYSRDAKPKSYDHGNTLTVPELPGFELKLADLFA